MTTYISILRGINVNGQNIIKMDALKKLYDSLDFENVQTYIQSGNVIFRTPATDKHQLEEKIGQAIERLFGLTVPIIVLTKDELSEIIKQNPFLNHSAVDPSLLHVTFLKEKPINFIPENIITKKQSGEEIIFTTQAIYLYCPQGYGKTKLNNNFLERQLKVSTTTRNWKTTLELLKIATNT